MKRFRIVVDTPGAAVLEVRVDGYVAGKLFMTRDAAAAFVDALRTGHVGLEGSGADIEIVVHPPSGGGA